MSDPLQLRYGFTYKTMSKRSLEARGQYNYYDSGGYIVSLGSEKQTAIAIITQLKADNWIDKQTRAIIVEFSLYNANTNLFTVAKVVMETPETGGFWAKQLVESFRPYPYVEPWDFILLVLQIVWGILVVYYIVITIIQLVKERMSYLTEFWNVTQILTLTMCVGAIVTFVLRTTSIISAVENVKNNIGKFLYPYFMNVLHINTTILLRITS